MRCPGGTGAGDTCLSDAQLAVVETWTGDVAFAAGRYTSPGYNLTGNEDDPLNFGVWASGDGEVRTAGQFQISDSAYKYYLAGDSAADSLRPCAWNAHRAALDRMAALTDATKANIAPFLDRGGKAIFWHGSADAGLSVNATIDYVERMRGAVGLAKADASTRLYVAPGVDHCMGGPSSDEADLLGALDRCVEAGEAAERLKAVKRDEDGSVRLARPLCRYPAYPRYTGPEGDAGAARLDGSYTCTQPSGAGK